MNSTPARRSSSWWPARVPHPAWCDHCGGPRSDGGHEACVVARELEPPRFCAHCRRRLKVQVLPVGWTATCVAHGELHSR